MQLLATLCAVWFTVVAVGISLVAYEELVDPFAKPTTQFIVSMVALNSWLGVIILHWIAFNV